jgi:hypothetical protein
MNESQDRTGSRREGLGGKIHLKKLRRPDKVQPLKYLDVRKEIRAGDVLLFQGQGFLSRVIRRVTHGKYSHSALVMPAWHNRLLVMQAEATGVEIAPASKAVDCYPGKVDWWALAEEAHQQLQSEKFLDALLEPVGKPYDFLGVIWLGLLKALHLKTRMPARKPSSYFCSDYVAEVLSKGGVDMGTIVTSSTVPSDFASCGLFVYQGTLHREAPAQAASSEGTEQARGT